MIEMSTKLHGVTSQNSVIITVTVGRTINPTCFLFAEENPATCVDDELKKSVRMRTVRYEKRPG